MSLVLLYTLLSPGGQPTVAGSFHKGTMPRVKKSNSSQCFLPRLNPYKRGTKLLGQIAGKTRPEKIESETNLITPKITPRCFSKCPLWKDRYVSLASSGRHNRLEKVNVPATE